MRDTSFSDSLRDFIWSRRPIFWVACAVGGVLLVFAALLWTRYGLVRIDYALSAPLKAGTATAREYSYEGGVDRKSSFRTVFGVTLVPRGTDYILATSGNAETVVPMTRLPKIGMTDMEVRIDPQQAVDKLGASVKSCNFSTDAGTFNYDCDDPHAIFKYVRPRREYWRNELVQTFFPGTTTKVRPYRAGLLGVVAARGATPSARLFYLVPGQKEPSSFPVPADMLTGGSAYLNLGVDPVDAGGEGFMLYNTRSGKVRYYTKFSEKAEPREMARRRAYDPTIDATQCVLRSVYIYCYTGVRGGSSDSHHESEAREQRAHPGVLEVFPISGDPGRLYEATETFGVERLFVTTSGAVYLQSNSQLYSADLANGQLRVTRISPRVGSVVAGDQLYWTTEWGIFAYDAGERSTRLLFTGAKLRMSDLSLDDRLLTFNAFAKDDPQSQLHSYRLSTDPLEGPRLEDKLPYTSSDLPIVLMDYTRDTLFVQLRVLVDRSEPGKAVLDQQSFDDAKAAVLDRLRKDGIDPDSVTQVFIY
ncbi:MAG TPA: hypothetical protein VFB74_02535 [Kribbellaceae bacterium]|nr:hypothetical protein [Kribbellaceae bacterium]